MRFSLLACASAAVATSALFIAGCGDNVTEVSETTKMTISVLDEKEAFPTCNRMNESDLVYSVDSGSTYLCYANRWIPLKGEDGEDGKDGRNGKSGRPGEKGETGEDGDGCVAENFKSDDGKRSGFIVTCGTSPADTLWNGANGDDGKDGKDGKNGEDGKDGQNGKDEQPYSFGSSCKLNPVVSADEIKRTGFEIVCDSLDGDTLVSVLIDTLWNGVDGKDGSIGEKGATGSSCVSTPVTLKNGQTGFEIACGSGETMTRDTLWNGKDGQNGLPGSIKSICSLTAVEVEGRTGLEIACGKGESATVDTLWNGTDGKSAKDGKNGVGCAYTNFLNEDGASGTEIICNGAEPDTVWNGTRGEPGEPGTDGDVGADCFVETDSLGIVIINCGTEENPLRSTVYKTLCYNTPYDPEEEVCDNGVLRHVVEYDEGDLQDDFDVKYSVVRIGSQMWMDNMRLMNNATTTSGDNICGGWHEDGNELTGCDARGRLYTYASATAEKLCPEGYVVPSRADWMELFKTVDPTVIIDDDSMTVTFASETLTHLKAKRVWGNADSGDDLWGFDFIPSGYAGIAGDNGENPMQTRKTGEGFYWTSVAGSTDDTAWTLHLTSTKIEFVLEPVSRSQSVRCVKNLN